MLNPVDGALDVRMMRTLLILLTECSVSRTADILGHSQPTVSLALRRLRMLFDDPLLVRSGSHLVPTERAVALRSAVARILEDIDRTLAPPVNFDPDTTDRRFRLVATNCLGILFLPRVVERVRRRAPQARIDICPLPPPHTLVTSLEEGEFDLVVGTSPSPPRQLRMAPLLSTDIVCLLNARHPLARAERIGLDDYLQLDHLSPSPQHLAPLSPIDGRLMELGLSRRVTVSVPEYSIVPYVLATTDLVFTTGRPFAEHLAAMMPFAVVEAPPELAQMHFYLLWHERTHRAPAHRWLRQLLKEVAAELKAIDTLLPVG